MNVTESLNGLKKMDLEKIRVLDCSILYPKFDSFNKYECP